MKLVVTAFFLVSTLFVPVISAFSATFSTSKETTYRFEIIVEDYNYGSMLKVRTDQFTLQRKTLATTTHGKEDKFEAVSCGHSVVLFVEDGEKIMPNGEWAKIQNSVLQVDSPWRVSWRDYKATFDSGKTGVFEGALFYASLNCPEKH